MTPKLRTTNINRLPTTDMRDIYIIELDKSYPPIIEHALTDFMSGVFKLSKDSKCLGNGLNITKIEPEQDNWNISNLTFIKNVHEDISQNEIDTLQKNEKIRIYKGYPKPPSQKSLIDEKMIGLYKINK